MVMIISLGVEAIGALDGEEEREGTTKISFAWDVDDGGALIGEWRLINSPAKAF